VKATLTVTQEPSDADYIAIATLLATFNRANGPADLNRGKLAVLLKDPTGTVIGGLFGWINCSWLHVELLAVPEELRGSGFGTRALAEAEAAARAQNCIGVWIDTYSFQAPDFYRRNGYEAFAELAGPTPGSSRIFLRKSL